MQREFYIGLMSGTSLDAIDATLVEFLQEKKIQIISTHSHEIPTQLKSNIQALSESCSSSVYQLGKVDIELGNQFARCILELLKKAKINPSEVIAIGSHGQTICHMPNENIPFTIQIGDPNIITKVTGITTVADFRRGDMAYGGQAAPLAPALHQYLFQTEEQNRFIVNIGGIANLTFLPKNLQEKVIGFDTGPGNTLLDNWCQQHTQKPYDAEGKWASQGNIHQALLTTLLADPYFKNPPPKSTGKEYFNLNWLNSYLCKQSDTLTSTDIQTTLTELTANSIASAILTTCNIPADIFFCGGGTYNTLLMNRLQKNLPKHRIATTAEIGLGPKWVETITFAWLARQTINHQPGNLPSVTGATRHTILGAIYPRSTH